jgi:hypothetical protein
MQTSSLSIGLSSGGSDTTELVQRIAAMEDTTYEYELWQSIGNGTSGTVSIPEGAVIRLDQYPNAGDALIVKCDGAGRPVDELAGQANGTAITATLDASGQFVLSGVPKSYPVAIVFQVALPQKSIPAIPLDSIVGYQVVRYTDAQAAAAAPVQAVAGKTGSVVLTKADVGLGSVDNTADADKPISTATQSALDTKAENTHSHTTDVVAEGSGNLYFTAQRVRDVLLTGLSTATNAAILATDSVVVAFGKAQAQITAILASLNSHIANTTNAHGMTMTGAAIVQAATVADQRAALGLDYHNLLTMYGNGSSAVLGSGQVTHILRGGASSGEGAAFYVQRPDSVTAAAFGQESAILGGIPSLTSVLYGGADIKYHSGSGVHTFNGRITAAGGLRSGDQLELMASGVHAWSWNTTANVGRLSLADEGTGYPLQVVKGVGRILLGYGAQDDGVSTLQVNGNVSAPSANLGGLTYGRGAVITTPAAGHFWICVGEFNYMAQVQVQVRLTSQNHEELLRIDLAQSYHANMARITVARHSYNAKVRSVAISSPAHNSNKQLWVETTHDEFLIICSAWVDGLGFISHPASVRADGSQPTMTVSCGMMAGYGRQDNSTYYGGAPLSHHQQDGTVAAGSGGRFGGGSPPGANPGVNHVLIDAAGVNGAGRILGVHANETVGLGLEIQRYGGDVQFGGDATSNVSVAGVISHLYDNAYSFGTAERRATTAYLATNPVVGSDARLKCDYSVIPGDIAHELLLKIVPRVGKFIVGGQEAYEVEEATTNEAGEEVTQKVTRYREVPGNRYHTYYLAQEVKAALDSVADRWPQAANLSVWLLSDVEDVDSIQMIRYEQMIPIIHAASNYRYNLPIGGTSEAR